MSCGVLIILCTTIISSHRQYVSVHSFYTKILSLRRCIIVLHQNHCLWHLLHDCNPIGHTTCLASKILTLAPGQNKQLNTWLVGDTYGMKLVKVYYLYRPPVCVWIVADRWSTLEVQHNYTAYNQKMCCSMVVSFSLSPCIIIHILLLIF